MLHSRLLLPLTSFALSVAAIGKRADATFQLFAYGKDIGGLALQYSDGFAYAVESDKTISGYTGLNFSTTSTGLMSGGSVTISSASSSNDTSIVGQLLAITPGTNAAIEFVSSKSSSQSTDGWTFFGTILTYQSTTSSFYAVPSGINGIYQIWWVTDTSSVVSGSEPVALKQSKPAELANPANPGNPNGELKRKRGIKVRQ